MCLKYHFVPEIERCKMKEQSCYLQVEFIDFVISGSFSYNWPAPPHEITYCFSFASMGPRTVRPKIGGCSIVCLTFRVKNQLHQSMNEPPSYRSWISQNWQALYWSNSPPLLSIVSPVYTFGNRLSNLVNNYDRSNVQSLFSKCIWLAIWHLI